jgi:hypothetical protein
MALLTMRMPKASHMVSGFGRNDTNTQAAPTTVKVGNQRTATKYTRGYRLRIAHRIVFLLALATFLASMVAGQNIMLEILSIILFAAAIILRLTWRAEFWPVKTVSKFLLV